MNSRILLVCFLAILAGCWDASVVSWFGFPFSAMRLVLVYSMLLALFSTGYRKSLVASLVGGMTADILLPSQGWIAFRMMIVVVLVHTLARFVFTNRSIWGICFLGSIAVIVDRMVLFVINRIPLFSGMMRTIESHAPILMEVIWVCFVCSFVFVCIVAFSRRFHPTLSRMDQMNRLPWG